MPTRPDLDVSFYDHLVPKATAGVYTVTVEHRLSKDGRPLDTAAELPPAEGRYEIRAARFHLDPSSVHALYPAAGAAGRYTHVLPHVTLTRAVLPWERTLAKRSVPAPWLALLLLAEGEALDDPAAAGEFTDRPVGELRRPTEPGTVGPELGGDIDDTLPCRTIDLPIGVFHAIAPRKAELLDLTHVRDVELAPQRRDDGEVLTEGAYAVLAANRFPRTPGSYAVHLVSLEGHLDRLEPGTLADAGHIRLCSLWSWSFTNAPDGTLDPGTLLRDLVAPGTADPERLALRHTPPAGGGDTAAERHIRTRLHHGYTALPQRTLAGESTYAWYRGPFTPLTAPELPREAVEGPHSTADHALVYDPAYGVFDVSYAAAWTLGRTIALADPEYSTEIVEARRALANRAATLAALGADPVRARQDPDALPGDTALGALAAAGLGARLVQALGGEPRRAPAPAPAARTARVRPARVRPAALLADPRARASLAAVAEAVTPTAPDWLERLALLRGVPFPHLVPDPRLLPPESLRAFRIDEGWIEALVAGAADVGAHTSTDHALAPLLRERRFRDGTRLPAAGLLMHSELVRAWPVFDLIATRAGEPVEELRRDHLAPDLLLVLWDAVPDSVSIREPGQGIHFGVNSEARISLRHLTGSAVGYPTGTEFPDPASGRTVFDHLRPGQGGRLPDVLTLHGDGGLLPALATACGSDLSPGRFALQLVNAPLEQLLLPAPRTDLPCEADTFVQYGQGPVDGTRHELMVKNEGPASSVTRIAYLRFDATGLPPADRIARAVVRVHAAARDAGGFDLLLHGTGNDWAESALAWADRPELSAQPLARARLGAVDAWTWLEFDVTDHVRARTGGRVSVALTKAQAARELAVITSREGTSHRPALIVTTTPTSNAGDSDR
ncbi:DNRLRE domain-containing protein [Kitasatospora sp. NPDC001309]|uniref:CBM96 family carbohydrate-binding protein n=1 Tax=Kitasatospora sp. NPDC001309 TaxID=3364013 RepID=UPI0036995C8A